ncbi:MAG TPA: nucleotide exchange factor GrpE, partial [Thalassobaculum sp.]
MSNETRNTNPAGEQPVVEETGPEVGVDEAGTVDTGEYEDPRDALIAALEEQVAQLRDQALRALAESENVRRRTEREKEQVKLYAAGGLAKELLSAVDNLRRALEAAPV